MTSLILTISSIFLFVASLIFIATAKDENNDSKK